MSSHPFVIVGASLAGAKAAEALRENGFEGRVVLTQAIDPPGDHALGSDRWVRLSVEHSHAP